MADLPPLPKSPAKDIGRPLQAGDAALNKADLAQSEAFIRWGKTKGIVAHEGRFRRSERDGMAQRRRSDMGRSPKGRR